MGKKESLLREKGSCYSCLFYISIRVHLHQCPVMIPVIYAPVRHLDLKEMELNYKNHSQRVIYPVELSTGNGTAAKIRRPNGQSPGYTLFIPFLWINPVGSTAGRLWRKSRLP